MTTFNENSKIGDIVTQFPGASDVFYRYKVDFCCGGNRPLADAINGQHLDGVALLQEVNEKYEDFLAQNQKFIDWVKEDSGKLIEYILNKHHAYLYEELPRLSEYVFKILKVHGHHHPELYQVHRLFNTLRTELEEHLIKEEEIIFPRIVALERNEDPKKRAQLVELINELEAEHTGAGDIIMELREVTDHYSIPGDGCKTFEITYNKLKALEMDLFQHIHLENNILFKKQ